MNNNNNKNNNKKKNENTTFIIVCVIVTLFTIMLITFLNNKIQESSRVEISYSEFLQMIEEDKIDSVEVSSNKIYIVPKKEDGTPYYSRIYYTGVMSSDLIRRYVTARLPDARFVPGKFASDNAIGVALLAAKEVGAWPSISRSTN